jgi:predicted permease
MKKLPLTLAIFSLFVTVASVNAQTSTPAATPAATPSSVDLAGSAVAAVAVIIVFAFIVYAGYRIIKKWSGPSKGESD